VVAGYIVHAWGFNAGFLFLGFIAAAAFVVYYLFVPETKGFSDSQLPSAPQVFLEKG
jgi:predicted MFS family arabinose efflux permease